MSVLRGEGVLNDCHFLDGRIGEGTLLRALVAFGVAEFCAIKPVGSGHGLAAIDAGRELAAAEDSVAVRLHRDEARLQLEQGLSESNVGPHHGRHFLVVSLADGVCDGRVLGVDLDRGGFDLDTLRDGADLKLHVLAHGLAAAQHDSGVGIELETLLAHLNCVGANLERWGAEVAGAVGADGGGCSGPLIDQVDLCVWNRGSRCISDKTGDYSAVSKLGLSAQHAEDQEQPKQKQTATRPPFHKHTPAGAPKYSSRKP